MISLLSSAEKEQYPLWTPLKRKEKACKARENLSGPVRGRYETQFSKWGADRGIRAGAGACEIRNCTVWGDALRGSTKRFRQFGCADHVGDALEVVSRCGNTDFRLCTGQTAHQQTGMSEDAVFETIPLSCKVIVSLERV
jgi:hypothetical protein